MTNAVHRTICLAVLFLLLAGCDGDGKPPLPQQDTSTDGAADTVADQPVDVSPDTATDTAEDPAVDVPPDTAADTAADTPADTFTDAEPDSTACWCGNGILEPACDEECDDGNFENMDDCLTTCKVATCGDGFRRGLPASPADEEECDDGNETSGDGCENDCTFSCHEGECDDANPCTLDFCDPSFHVCEAIPDTEAEGSICGTGDICTGLGTCISGECVYSGGLTCDDEQPCTEDSCDPTEGCIYEPLPEGSSCDDGFFCWTGDQCWGPYGFCSGVPEHPCDDGDPCTEDICNEDLDTCIYESPTYRTVTCGGEARSNTGSMDSNYDSFTCPDGSHSMSGPDEVNQIEVTGTGNLVLTNSAERTAPGTEYFILSDACDTASCLGHGQDSVTVSATPGTYYVVTESTGTGGPYGYTVTCP